MRVIYRKIRHARYLYIKRNVENVWGARYTLGARYLSKNTVIRKSYYLTRAVIKFSSPPPTRLGAEGNSRHSDRNISLFPSWLG